MPDFESLPYPSVDEIEAISLAQEFIEMADNESYTPEQAHDDAVIFLNARNAVNAGFIDSISRRSPHGSLQFYMSK